MVVEYPSGATGSCFSICTITPRVICWCTGSAIPLVFPQICIAVGLSFLAVYLEDQGGNPLADTSSPLAVGILVSFLLVFKTQNSYNQFWHALDALDGVLQLSRSVAMCVCTLFDWEKNDEVKVRARKIVRLLVLHFFIVIEFFQRTGSNATTKASVMDDVREDIRQLAGPTEFDLLYPGEPKGTPGSKSDHAHANSAMVLFWIQLATSRVHHDGACPAPIAMGLQTKLEGIMKHYSSMNKVDKTQFPFPYAQIVKILVMFWVFSLPFFIASDCKEWTPVICGLAALGFFGLDEVAEILESPFGTDPNDIMLREYGRDLMCDLEMVYNGREQELDSVIGGEAALNFTELLQGRFEKQSRSRSNELTHLMGKASKSTTSSLGRAVVPTPDPGPPLT